MIKVRTYLVQISDLKLGDKRVEDMRWLCSCVHRAYGSLPEVDTQWVRARISPFNPRSIGFCASIFKDRGAATAERVTNQEKQRIERSEVTPWGKCQRRGGLEARNRPSKSAELPDEPSLTREDGWPMVLCKDEVEIGNSD